MSDGHNPGKTLNRGLDRRHGRRLFMGIIRDDMERKKAEDARSIRCSITHCIGVDDGLVTIFRVLTVQVR